MSAFAVSIILVRVVLPLGISFHTFQGISYTLDVYRRVVKPINRYSTFLTFVVLWPALIALFLYALLPITRNTHAGLAQVPRGLLQAGTALGLSPGNILYRIELPLARETIMAGVKTSAVINVGTATIAAFIGAGGFGERIAQGLALNDHTVLLAGALPAAALALAVHAAFELAERCLARRPR